MNLKILLIMIIAWSIPRVVLAQQTISGKVVDQATSEGLPGVNIAIQGTSSGTVTDSEGRFSISAAPNDVMVFSFIGYKPISEKVGERTIVDITMSLDVTELGEVIVVGYNTAKVKDISSAIGAVNLENVKDFPAGNAMKNIQGRVAGLQVISNGNPASTATVRIRGAGIGTLGNNDPLYVIDGMPTKSGMHELNQNDIESISVLKDAASASIYGSRAANGVILITTKKGSQGLKVNLKSSVSSEFFDFKVGPLNTQERAEVLWRAAVNDSIDPNTVSPLYRYQWNGDFASPQLDKVLLPEFIDGAREMRPANTNWFEEITRSSIIQDHDVSLSNGNDRGKYYMSFGYFNHDGIVKYSNFKRYTVKVNSEYNVAKNNRFKVGQNLVVTNQRANKVNDLAGNAIGLSIEQQSIVPVRTVDGNEWGGPTGGITDRDNPVRLIEENKDNQYRFNRILGNVFAEASPIENLSLRSSFGIDYNIFSYRDFTKAFSPGNLNFADQLVNTYNNYGNWIWSNTATYNLNLTNHKFSFLIGSESIAFSQEEFSASRRGFTGQNLDYAYLNQGTDNIQNGGSGSKWTLQSFFGKADYNFKDKYLASVTIRRDGSSRFGANNRYGNFPAISAAWRISEESFLQGVSVISEMKLRGSWGLTGNQEINSRAQFAVFESRYATRSLFTFDQDNGTAYDLYGNNSGQLPSGFAKTQSGNPDLKWETSETIDAGLDLGFLDDKITATVDYYIKTTEDILTLTKPVATEGEGAARFVNGGTVENKGFEISLGYNSEITLAGKQLGLSINGNVSHISNKVVDLPLSVLSVFPGNGTDKTIKGRPVNSVYGYVANGLFQSREEVESHADQSGAASGRVRFKDLNEDGVINDQDQTFFANRDPNYLFGLNLDLTYGKFDLNVFFQGIQGGQAENGFRLFTDFTSVNAGSNYGRRTLNAWTPENTATDVPALTTRDNNNEWRVSTFRYEDQSYVKLRNLSIGFNPSVEGLSRIGLKRARVYIAGQNLFTIKNKNTIMQDPETPGSTFPVPRRISLGANLTF